MDILIISIFLYEVYIMNNLSKINMEIHKAVKQLYKDFNSIVVHISDKEKVFIDIEKVIVVNDFKIKDNKVLIEVTEQIDEVDYYKDHTGLRFDLDEYEVAKAVNTKFVRHLKAVYKEKTVTKEFEFNKELSLVSSDNKYISNDYIESTGYNTSGYTDIKFCPKHYIHDQLPKYKNISYTETGMISNRNIGIYLNDHDNNFSTDVIFRSSVNDYIICKNLDELNNVKLAIDKILEDINTLVNNFKKRTFTFDDIKKYFDEDYYASDDYFSSDAFNDFFGTYVNVESIKQKYIDLLPPDTYVH